MHEKQRPIRIFLMEDHPVVRDSLKKLLNQERDFHVCGDADNAKTGLRQILDDEPDIIILDISLNASSGFDIIKSVRAKCNKSKMLVFSMHDEKLYAERCIRAGANGYVMKREPTERLLAAIREVLAGKTSLSDDMLGRLAQKFMAGRRLDQTLPHERLSDRELEIFNLLGAGLPSRKIARSLDINIKTVQTHCANIKEKLGLSTATELLREATKWSDSSSSF